MRKTTSIIIAALHCLTCLSCGTEKAETKNQDTLERYNVVWTTPSKDQNGSMPIGNGDLAANVWVEPGGDLVFYLSKSDAWGGGQQNLKLGRIRIRLEEPLFREGTVFKQELDLESGCISITSMNREHQNSVLFWIDAMQAVVNVEIKGSKKFRAEVALEMWRTQGARLYGEGRWHTALDRLKDLQGQRAMATQKS